MLMCAMLQDLNCVLKAWRTTEEPYKSQWCDLMQAGFWYKVLNHGHSRGAREEKICSRDVYEAELPELTEWFCQRNKGRTRAQNDE